MSTVTKVVARKPKRVKAQRVAAYCRVSTDTTKQGLSLENQEAHYQALIEAHENWNLVGIFHDDGISGTKMDKRQGLANLLTACEESRVDLVITKSISQLARNTTDCLHIVRKLKNLKIPIIFERENINTSSMDGELMLTVLSQSSPRWIYVNLQEHQIRDSPPGWKWGLPSFLCPLRLS